MDRRTVALAAALLLAAASPVPGAAAQEADPPAPAPRSPRPGDGDPSPGPGSHREPGKSPGTPSRVYIPFEDLKKVFEKEGQGVFVPWAEFQDLWRRAHAQREASDLPAGVASAVYEGRIEGDLAIVRADLEVVASADGESTVPVGLGGAALGEAILDGRPAVIVSDGDKGRRVVVRGRGAHRLQVTLVAPVTPRDGDRTVAFPSAGAPVSRLAFTVPGEGVKVTVDPNLATTRTDAGSGTTLVQAFVGAAKEVRLTWRPRPVEAAGVAAVLQARAEVLHRVGEQTVETSGHAALEVLRAPMRSFRMRFPASARVLRIQGSDIRSWEDREIPGGLREVLLELHGEVQGAWELKFDLETPREGGTAVLPAVAFEGASRESGWEAVAAVSPVSVRPSAVEGCYRVRPQDLAKWMQGADTVLAYRYTGRGRRIALAIETIQPEVAAAERSLLELGGGAALLRSILDFEVRRAGLFQVSVGIPAGYALESASAGDDKGALRPVDARVEGEGADRRATLDLGTRRTGAFPVHLLLRRDLEAGEAESSIDLPVLRPAGTVRVRGVLAVAADEGLDVRASALRGFVPADPRDLGQGLPAPEPGPGGARPVLFGFRHGGEERSGSLAIVRRKPLVTAETVTTAAVEEDRLRVRHSVRFLVRYAGVDAFRIALPKAVSDRARVDGPGIKERSKESEPEGDRVLHTVRMQAPVLGELVLVVDYDLPHEPLKVGGSRKVDVPSAMVRGVEREAGWYAVTRDPALSVEGEAKNLVYADAREVPAWSGAGDAFLAWRFLAHPHGLTLSATKHETLGVLQAVVNGLALDTLVGGGAVALTEARMDVQVNGLQYLRVELPERAEVESVEVDGRPVSPRREGAALLLPCPAGRGRDDRFPVRLVYREPAPGAAGRSFAAALRAPRLPDAMVQGTAWTLWVPPDAVLFSGGGNLRPAEGPGSIAGLLHEVAAAFGGAQAVPGAPTTRGGALPPKVTLEVSGRRPFSFHRTGEDADLSARFLPRTVVGALAIAAGALALALGWILARRGASLFAIALAFGAAALVLGPFAAPGLEPALSAVIGAAGGLFAAGCFVAVRRARREQAAPAPPPAAPPAPPAGSAS
jgi:hypothetical protein